jgi:arylsulfatase A-like enzyme
MKKINFRKTHSFIILFLFPASLVLSSCNTTEKKPNVILIMADDMGWGDTGYNGNEIILTPHLDQMSEDGLRFDRFYSASAVCSPTRASVLTGRNPFRMGVFTANNGILRPEEITIAEALKKHGYTTGHFGKWHLGTLTDKIRDANRGREGNTKDYNPPALHGFDVNFSTESKVPTWDPMKKGAKGDEHYGTHYWNTQGDIVTDNLEGDDSRVIMDRVLPFIEKSSNGEKPFLAVVWFHTPHKPCVAGPEYRAMYKDHNEKMQHYAGCITAMDEQIGRLRTYLEDIGEAKNTMIWFCSDNGPENGNPGSTGGFRERKRSLHDGGIRVPGLLVWPERVSKASSTSIPCVTSDYLPTILDVVGEDLTSWPVELDGSSLLPLINGEELQREEPIAFAFGSQIAFIDTRFKLYCRDSVFSYYDMKNDPFEEQDIIESNQDDSDSYLDQNISWLDRCEKSFKGAEYGTESVLRMDQKWQNPLKKKKNKKNG